MNNTQQQQQHIYLLVVILVVVFFVCNIIKCVVQWIIIMNRRSLVSYNASLLKKTFSFDDEVKKLWRRNDIAVVT